MIIHFDDTYRSSTTRNKYGGFHTCALNTAFTLLSYHDSIYVKRKIYLCSSDYDAALVSTKRWSAESAFLALPRMLSRDEPLFTLIFISRLCLMRIAAFCLSTINIYMLSAWKRMAQRKHSFSLCTHIFTPPQKGADYHIPPCLCTDFDLTIDLISKVFHAI